jgi:hypothetical protein
MGRKQVESARRAIVGVAQSRREGFPCHCRTPPTRIGHVIILIYRLPDCVGDWQYGSTEPMGPSRTNGLRGDRSVESEGLRT